MFATALEQVDGLNLNPTDCHDEILPAVIGACDDDPEIDTSDAPTFKVPDGFPELLAALPTDVLRVQPESATGIYELADQFFLKKQQGGDADQK
jgi:hypothetical protein